MTDARYMLLKDWSGEFDKDAAAVIGEIIPASPLLAEMLWRPSSDRYGHELVMRVGEPCMGESRTNARTRFGCGIIFAHDNHSLTMKMERTVFHGNAITRPEDWMGLSAFFSSRTEAMNGVNILDAGGTEDVFSVWLVGWGAQACFGFFPPNTPAGLSVHGPHIWCAGIGLSDWRFVVRVANIPADMDGNRLQDFLGRALGIVPALNGQVSFAFYCNEAMKERLPNRFGGVPVRAVAALNHPEIRI